jgi:predicted transcriptional regulator
MGRTRLKKVQIEYRRKQVTELHLMGWKQTSIAGKLGVSQATISTDMKAIRKEWKDSRIRDFDLAVEEHLEKEQVVLREAWGGWLRSKEPIEMTRFTQGNGKKRAEKTLRHGPGDPRFLQVVHRVMESNCKLLGLDAAADKAFEKSDKESLREQAKSFDWDLYYRLINSKVPLPKAIDDFIEEFVEEETKSESADIGT